MAKNGTTTKIIYDFNDKEQIDKICALDVRFKKAKKELENAKEQAKIFAKKAGKKMIDGNTGYIEITATEEDYVEPNDIWNLVGKKFANYILVSKIIMKELKEYVKGADKEAELIALVSKIAGSTRVSLKTK